MKRLVSVTALLLLAVSTFGFDPAAKAAPKAGAKRKKAAPTAVARPKLAAAPKPMVVDGFTMPGQVTGTAVSMATGTGMQPRFWAGVNLGATLPGTWPGELAPTRKDYDRWLAQMGELGATLIRTYTIIRPDFYDALRAYNLAHADDPLFVLQGIWVPEERMTETLDAYDPAVLAEFQGEINDIVSVVHGDFTRPHTPGHASGVYTSDVSPWVLGYSLGVEWDPYIVAGTNEKNATRAVPEGTYIKVSANANPMERWIGMHLDHLAAQEAKRGWSRPLTFTNWVTADPLKHPDEPFPDEDNIVVDSMHFSATSKWPSGFFASYHAYPYYPDFLRIQPSYQNFTNKTGEPDAYAGYLADLRQHHQGQALMITEFGQPTSIGMAHRGPNGRDQGGHSEQQSALNNAAMMKDIYDTGLAGGIMFEWVDEWFKFTWNTIEHEMPKDRRAMWRNPLTNEEHFGIIAMEAGATQKVVIDGRDKEWTNKQSRVILKAAHGVQEVRATHDEESLYLRLKLEQPGAAKKPAAGVPVKNVWDDREIVVGLDLHPEGNQGLPDRPGVSPESDVAVIVGPGNKARLRIAAFTDPLPFEFGIKRKEIEINLADLQPGSGVWREPMQIESRPLYIPTTDQKLPTDVQSYGDLRWGTNDPASPSFDDRALVNGSGGVLELRLPWGMIGMSDPSSKQVLVPKFEGSVVSLTSIPIERVGISVIGADGTLQNTPGYPWDAWNIVKWHERKKAGWPILQRAFYSYLTSAPVPSAPAASTGGTVTAPPSVSTATAPATS